MRHTLFAFLFFLLPLLGGAQKNANQLKVDSLEQVLPTLSDSLRLKALKDLAQLTTYNDPSHTYLNKLEEEAKKQNSAYFQAFVWAKRVEYFYSDFQSDTIFRVGAKAEEFTQKHKEYDFLSVIQQTIAKRYIDQKLYALGLTKVQQMYRDALKRSDYMALARASNTIGEAYGKMGIWEEEKAFLNESLQWLDRAGNPYRSLYVENYRNLAVLHLNTKDYSQSLLYVDSMDRKMDEIIREGRNMDFSYDRYLIEYLRGLATVRLGEYARSLEYIHKAETLLNAAWPEFFRQQLNELYASYYYETGNFSKAYAYNEQALCFYIDNQMETMVINGYEKKGDILGRQGDFKSAVDVYELYIERNNAHNQAKFKSQINEMRTLYDLEKVEMQAAQDRIQLLSARRLAIALSVALFLVGCIVVLVALNRRRLAQKNRLLFRQLEEKDKLLQQEIIRIDRQPEEPRGQGTTDRDLFDRLEELMRERQLYTQTDISRKSIAAELFTNENYLFTAIRDRLDLSFNEYINNLRLEHARKLLYRMQTDTTIEEISLVSGFGTRKTFTRLFRERYGMSPSEFRRIAAEERAN